MNSTRWNVSAVAGSAGPVVGTTWKARVAWSGLTPNGTTLRTPSMTFRRVAIIACTLASDASSVGRSSSGRVVTATIGPLMPGPNCSPTVV